MTPDDFVRSLTPSGELQPADCLLDQFRKIRTSQVSIIFSVLTRGKSFGRAIRFGSAETTSLYRPIYQYILTVSSNIIFQTKMFNKSSGGINSTW